MELRKLRDFGENINDTFQFIRQEFKPLLKSFFAIAGVLILVTGIISGYYQSGSVSNFLKALNGIEQRGQSLDEIFTPTYFLLLLLSTFNFVLMRVVLVVYVKLYDIKGGISPTVEEVWKEMLHYIVPVFFYAILIGIIVGLGCVLCVAPGIYLVIVFAPVNFIFIIEDLSFGNAYNRCFYLIKENFWNSLGLYLVVYLIYAFSSGVIGVGISVIAGFAAYFTTKDIAATVRIISGILSVFQQVFYIIFSVSIALQYFNLVEQKDGSGLLRRIENLGDDTTDTSNNEQF